MNKSVGPIITGAAVGIAVGAAASAIGGRKRTVSSRTLKRNAGKAIRAVSGIINTVSTTLK